MVRPFVSENQSVLSGQELVVAEPVEETTSSNSNFHCFEEAVLKLFKMIARKILFVSDTRRRHSDSFTKRLSLND